MTNRWSQSLSDAVETCLQSDPNSRLFLPAGQARCDADRLEAEFGLHRIYRSQLTAGSLVGLAAGAARAGARTIVELPTNTSITQTIGHLVTHIGNAQFHSPGRLHLPLLIRAVINHVHDIADELSLANIPGIYVAVPGSATDAGAMARAACDLVAPVLLLESQELIDKELASEAPLDEIANSTLGQAAIRRTGSSLTVVTVGADLHRTIDAAAVLASEGIEAEVIDLRCLSPMDLTTLVASVQKTRRALIIDRATTQGGWSAELAVRLNQRVHSALASPIMRCHDYQDVAPTAFGVDELVQVMRRCASGISTEWDG